MGRSAEHRQRPDSDVQRMPGLVAHPWKRYGHERVYFKTSDGLQVGWWDCLAGVAYLEDESHAAEFSAAVSRLIPAGRVPVEEQPPAARQPPVQPSLLGTPLLEGDLALNRAGQRAAEVERAARGAAPVRTRLERLFDVKNDERAWRLGRKGEEAVGARLARLPNDWHVLHSIEVGVQGSDIDHLAVGPGGVYTINAKHHPDANVWVGGDRFMVNGQWHPYVRNSRHEAARASRILSRHAGFGVPVVGVIAVMGAQNGFTVKAQPEDGKVYVVTRKQIDAWLGRRSAVLNAWQVSAVFDVARRPGIWIG